MIEEVTNDKIERLKITYPGIGIMVNKQYLVVTIKLLGTHIFNIHF